MSWDKISESTHEWLVVLRRIFYEHSDIYCLNNNIFLSVFYLLTWIRFLWHVWIINDDKQYVILFHVSQFYQISCSIYTTWNKIWSMRSCQSLILSRNISFTCKRNTLWRADFRVKARVSNVTLVFSETCFDERIARGYCQQFLLSSLFLRV